MMRWMHGNSLWLEEFIPFRNMSRSLHFFVQLKMHQEAPDMFANAQAGCHFKSINCQARNPCEPFSIGAHLWPYPFYFSSAVSVCVTFLIRVVVLSSFSFLPRFSPPGFDAPGSTRYACKRTGGWPCQVNWSPGVQTTPPYNCSMRTVLYRCSSATLPILPFVSLLRLRNVFRLNAIVSFRLFTFSVFFNFVDFPLIVVAFLK